jgi:uncharacterized membrane protein
MAAMAAGTLTTTVEVGAGFWGTASTGISRAANFLIVPVFLLNKKEDPGA